MLVIFYNFNFKDIILEKNIQGSQSPGLFNPWSLWNQVNLIYLSIIYQKLSIRYLRQNWLSKYLGHLPNGAARTNRKWIRFRLHRRSDSALRNSTFPVLFFWQVASPFSGNRELRISELLANATGRKAFRRLWPRFCTGRGLPDRRSGVPCSLAENEGWLTLFLFKLQIWICFEMLRMSLLVSTTIENSLINI